MNLCWSTRNSPGAIGGSIVHFGDMYQGPVNSRLYSERDDRRPTIPDVVLGMAGDGFKRIGERLITSSGGLHSEVSAGSPFFLHSSVSTYGQRHRAGEGATLEFVWVHAPPILHRTFPLNIFMVTFLKNSPPRCSYFRGQSRWHIFSRWITSLLKFVHERLPIEHIFIHNRLAWPFRARAFMH